MNIAKAKKKTLFPRFIMPKNLLKEKAGSGGILPALLHKAKEHMETIDIDYSPIGRRLVKTYTENIDILKEDKDNENFSLAQETTALSLVRIKESAGMFNYTLLSTASEIGLQFLESVQAPNDDVIDFLKTHQNALSAILDHNIKNVDSKEGKIMLKDLNEAYERYIKKHGRKTL